MCARARVYIVICGIHFFTSPRRALAMRPMPASAELVCQSTLYVRMVNRYLFSTIQLLPLMCAYTWAPLTMALRLALALPLMSTLTMGSSSYSSGRQLFGLAEHGKLVSKGASACTVHSPCALCEGDCDTDAECARGPSASPGSAAARPTIPCLSAGSCPSASQLGDCAHAHSA